MKQGQQLVRTSVFMAEDKHKSTRRFISTSRFCPLVFDVTKCVRGELMNAQRYAYFPDRFQRNLKSKNSTKICVYNEIYTQLMRDYREYFLLD